MQIVVFVEPDRQLRNRVLPGGVRELFPAAGARFCKAYIRNGERVECDPPVMLDQLRQALGWEAAFAVEFAEDDEDFVARIRDKDVPTDATDVQIVEFEQLPSQDFRGAWVISDGAVVIDMGKAREIHRDRLRALRAPKLAALDIDFMRAIETGDTAGQAAIAARKQGLRDVTNVPEIDAAATPEQLKAAVPAILIF